MTPVGWPEIRPGRLGTGVVLEGKVLWALRIKDDPRHDRVRQRLLALIEKGLPLVVCYTSVLEVVQRIEAEIGPGEAGGFLRGVREILNVVLPLEEDIEAAEELLAQGVEGLALDQAIAGVAARRLGCSIYGFAPAYHLLRVPVVVD